MGRRPSGVTRAIDDLVSGLREAGPEARVAVLPQGPLTIPYLRDGVVPLKKAA